MDAPPDEQYFVWLYQKVASIRLKNPSRTYWSLLRHIYRKEYVWLIPNDDNRVEDGRFLREEFLEETGAEPPAEWLAMGCSLLEMMIGLSRRLAFEGDGEPRDWFWSLISNLELNDLCDAEYRNSRHQRDVDQVLDRVIWRTYDPDGRGGFFPLHHPSVDQRRVEVWYQLNAYLLELDEEGG